MDLKKINFRQPKYVLPLVVAVPAVCLIYFVSQVFGGSSEKAEPTDRINTSLPEAKIDPDYDKLRSMEARYAKDNGALSAVDGFDDEQQGKESLDDEYSEEEMQKIIEEAERKQREMQQMNDLQNKMTSSTARLDRGRQTSHEDDYDVERELDRIQSKSKQRIDDILREADLDEEKRAEENRRAREAEEKRKAEAPSKVIKASSVSHHSFNTVNANFAEASDSPLIKAMIDKTTKSTDGTRLRFKLLDDVIIEDIKLLKGSYLYGTVTGFDTQRVKAQITSILAGSRFLKVSLSVYDVDGMEGFYVPASSFREFLKNAAAGVAGQQIQLSNNSGTGDGINPELLALQALQNIYTAGSSAISGNVRKNKAKIKYNTIVYLINTQNIK